MSNQDLAQLFKWHTKVDIKNRDGSIATTMHIRLVGDVDYNQAQQYGLVASRRLRKQLRTEATIENQSMFLDLADRAKDDLIFGTIIAELGNLRDAAMSELGDIPEIPVPSNPSLEDREKHMTAEEEANKERLAKIQAKIEEKSTARREELDKLSIEEIRKIFVESSINFKCLEEFSNAFRDYCVFAGTFSDPDFKIHAFADFDGFRNASPNLKRQLTDAYLLLEITGEQLKN